MNQFCILFLYFIPTYITFFSLPIFPASEKGIVGNSISLVDGTLVTDDECISFYAKENNVFVIKLLEVIGVMDIDGNDEIRVMDIDGNDEIEIKYVENVVPNTVVVANKVIVPNKVVVANKVAVPQTVEVVTIQEETNMDPDAISVTDKIVCRETVDLLGLVNNFPIKVENFSVKIQNKIKTNVRLTNAEKNQFIQRVVDDMQKIYGFNPTSFVIEGVAKKLLFAFPILCQVDDEGNKIGNGEFTTIRQIKDRLYYLNNSKGPKKKNSSVNSLHFNILKTQTDSFGTITEE